MVRKRDVRKDCPPWSTPMTTENTLSQAGYQEHHIIPKNNQESVTRAMHTPRINSTQRDQRWKIVALLSLAAVTGAEALGAIWNQKEVINERVDLIEINHFHDDQGRPVFDQVIFYDWSEADNRYQIRDWRLLKNSNQVPLRSTQDGNYSAVWNDFKARDVIRKTESKLIRETWTTFDPELVEREFLPEGKRRKLREPPRR